jgi:osmotically-inducible protein OsmY
LAVESTPLLLGSGVAFSDGERAKLAAFEVDDSLEILNIVVSRGFLRWAESVRLPFTVAVRWSKTGIEASCTSVEAFAREVPPVAAPVRPVSHETPVAVPGAHVLGALVNGPTKRVTALIVQSGSRRLSVPAAEVSFEGKLMHVTTAPETLQEYRFDEEITRDAWHRLRGDRGIAPSEIRLMDVESAGGTVTLTGNVRRKQTRERAGALVSHVPGVARLHNKIADDLQLESDLGWALERAGVRRTASIHPRSSLGDVVLYGHAPSRQIVEDAIRAASGVNGVRTVTSRVDVDASRSSVAA